ncbi:unnamed protein product [Alopecurus aequalis]
MASMGFSYAQIHVRQERVRRKISDEASATSTKNKLMTEEESKKNKSFVVEKPVCDSRTTGRVHPCVSSMAADALPPTGGHR